MRYRRADGEFAETTLDRVVPAEVVAGLPVREFRWYKGRQHYSGWYWSATMSGHVVYESRLELARIMLADFDPAVAGLAAQPFLLTGPDGGRDRRHVPDLLLAGGDGAVTVVDVKAASRLRDPEVRAQFSWTRAVAASRGWGFEAWSGADGRLLDNDSHRCEPLTDLSYPVVLLQGRKSGSDRFIECFRRDLYGVLNVSNILYRNCARSKNHVQERNIFVFCSPVRVAILQADCGE